VAKTISLDRYLHSAYQPDVDFVDGVLKDRLWGEYDHGVTKRELLIALNTICKPEGMQVGFSVRVRVSENRVRIADLCVLPKDWKRTQIIEMPPVLCIEVLETVDTFTGVMSRVSDFIAMGVPEVWIVDPASRSVSITREDTTTPHRERSLMLPETTRTISLAEVFSALDEE
jgi:Uma2 family endonuclease